MENEHMKTAKVIYMAICMLVAIVLGDCAVGVWTAAEGAARADGAVEAQGENCPELLEMINQYNAVTRPELRPEE